MPLRTGFALPVQSCFGLFIDGQDGALINQRGAVAQFLPIED